MRSWRELVRNDELWWKCGEAPVPDCHRFCFLFPLFRRTAMKLCAAIAVFLWCAAASLTWAAKIVIVPPIMFESHLYIFKTLASALHREGHDTVFLVSEGRDVPPSEHYRLQRYPGIFNSTSADNFLQSKVKNIFSGRWTALELSDILDHYSQNCDVMVGSKALMTRLKEEKFDLLLVDPNEMCGFVIAHLLGVRYAVFSTGLWYPAEVGAPAPLSYVPEFNSLQTDKMTFFQRIINTAVYMVSRFGVQFLVLPKYDWIMKKHNIQPETSMHELVQGSRLWMLCTDMALEFPRPTLPHVVYVGGILTKPPNPLPQVGAECLLQTARGSFFVVVVCGSMHAGRSVPDSSPGRPTLLRLFTGLPDCLRLMTSSLGNSI